MSRRLLTFVLALLLATFTIAVTGGGVFIIGATTLSARSVGTSYPAGFVMKTRSVIRRATSTSSR